MVNDDFQKWALGFSGCDGGDLGSSNEQSIWFCGIEWGGGFLDDTKKLQEIFKKDVSKMSFGFENPDENTAYIYNWQAMKLLSAVHGGKTSEYKEFAKKFKPFVKNEKGFCRLNLYPLAFKNTNHELWSESFTKTTGFKNKNEYIKWIQENRFLVMQNWVKTYNPKLIICTGISYKNDFIKAFGYENAKINKELIEDKIFYWFKNPNGTLVVIIYFMIGRYGLSKDSVIQKTGEKIAQISKNNI